MILRKSLTVGLFWKNISKNHVHGPCVSCLSFNYNNRRCKSSDTNEAVKCDPIEIKDNLNQQKVISKSLSSSGKSGKSSAAKSLSHGIKSRTFKSTTPDPNVVITSHIVDVVSDVSKPVDPPKTREGTPVKLVNTEDVEWSPRLYPSLSELPIFWLRLSKYRLTSLVVATTLAGYTMGCHSFDPLLLSATLIGTGLTSASAAAFNQFLEVPYDSQMSRTKSRPLVTGQMTSLHAFTFATVTGILGLTILTSYVNVITAVLGGLNLVLYSFIYTPMKRRNILNTWIGSFVGATPPVMGYTAATGLIDPSGLLLGLILYSWQFPHFNALSWNLRHDYARAGYRMMVVTNPDLCLRTQLRHSLLLSAYCLMLSSGYIGLTSVFFSIDTLPFNLYLIYLSYKFKVDPSAKSSRKLFRYSLIHLPAIILLMILSKTVKDHKINNTSLNSSPDIIETEKT